VNLYVGPSQNVGTTTYFYDDVGNRDSVANANATATGYHYDGLNRLVNVTNWGVDRSVISSYTYTLNNAGIRTAVDEADGSHVAYGYDASYKLTNETRTGGSTGSPAGYSIVYVYDNVGNRQSQVKDGASTSYTYNNRDQLTSETGLTGVTTYTYDHAGRMQTKTDASGKITYTWLDNDRMASVSGPNVFVTYDYDAAGQRVSETSGTTTKKYLIDYQLPYGQVVAETDGSNNLAASYVFGLDRISMTRGANTHTYVADGQGSIRQLTNAAGTVTDEYYYTAFGVQR
jgi:YD repeat-containing protein